MIKTIIFDFSGVLAEEITLTLEKKYHFAKLPQSKQRLYVHAMHNSNEGKISSATLLKVMQKTLLPQFTVTELRKLWATSKALPPSKILQKLRKNYQVLILSNHQKTWPALIIKHNGMNVAGVPFINSSRLGMRKPHLNIYQYTIRKYNINPKETLFIDDRAVNLIPARKLGMRTYHYQNNFSALVKYLKKLDITGL